MEENENALVDHGCPLSGEVRERIDALCDQFECQWRTGSRPRLEDFVALGPQNHQPRLLSELLRVELQLRQQAGEALRVDDYHARFPAQMHLIDSVFCQEAAAEKAESRLLEAIPLPADAAGSGAALRLEGYELCEEIAHGGMGVVYKARQVYMNRLVALKVLPEHLLRDQQVSARFRREMELVGRLEHPNIVRAYDAGQQAGVQFLVMEYIDGLNLQELVARRAALPVAAACELVRQAALGLQHAWQHGLIHRDIKPANLMRGPDDPRVDPYGYGDGHSGLHGARAMGKPQRRRHPRRHL
jgi:hypothetical protein